MRGRLGSPRSRRAGAIRCACTASGRLAAQALDRAREVVAGAIGARPDEVVFTASGAHSAYAAVAGLALGRRRMGSRIVTTAVDHSSVLRAAAASGDHQAVGVDRQGRVDLDAWHNAIAVDGTAVAAIQVANHEVGTLQPYARGNRGRRARGRAGRRGRDCGTGPGRPQPEHRVVGADRIGGRVRRAGLGRPAGDQEGRPLAPAVPGRRLSGPPLAGGPRRAGHLRGRGRIGQLAALRPGGRRAPARADRTAPDRDHSPRCPMWTWPGTR